MRTLPLARERFGLLHSSQPLRSLIGRPGKELAAKAIHRLSSRAGGPFVARNAAAIPASLIDAELFGNRRDYPNAGMPEREGLIGAASGGTLFLDEIGELGSELQSHLLRLLDHGGEYHRLGEATARRSDLRVVAATNRPPEALKHDLLSRFSIRLSVPPLGARREDVPLLAHHLLEEAARTVPRFRARFFQTTASGASLPRLDPAFIEALLRWPWSAHARELRTLLWASLASSPLHFLATPAEMAIATAQSGPIRDRPAADGDEPSASAIREALAAHAGDREAACEALGLRNRFALYRLMRKHGIRLPVEPW